MKLRASTKLEFLRTSSTTSLLQLARHRPSMLFCRLFFYQQVFVSGLTVIRECPSQQCQRRCRQRGHARGCCATETRDDRSRKNIARLLVDRESKKEPFLNIYIGLYIVGTTTYYDEMFRYLLFTKIRNNILL